MTINVETPPPEGAELNIWWQGLAEGGVVDAEAHRELRPLDPQDLGDALLEVRPDRVSAHLVFRHRGLLAVDDQDVVVAAVGVNVAVLRDGATDVQVPSRLVRERAVRGTFLGDPADHVVDDGDDLVPLHLGDVITTGVVPQADSGHFMPLSLGGNPSYTLS
jgi:hypothetical protein